MPDLKGSRTERSDESVTYRPHLLLGLPCSTFLPSFRVENLS